MYWNSDSNVCQWRANIFVKLIKLITIIIIIARKLKGTYVKLIREWNYGVMTGYCDNYNLNHNYYFWNLMVIFGLANCVRWVSFYFTIYWIHRYVMIYDVEIIGHLAIFFIQQIK